MKKINKPWGYYVVLHKEKDYLIKKIVVYAGQRISLQYHNKRKEYWTVVSGNGIGEIGNTSIVLNKGRNVFIPIKTQHRIEAKSKMEFIEVQIGHCDESDIVRLEDDYDRI